MDSLAQDFTSLHWWVSVVGVGLLVSLASAYIKPSLDRYLEGTSARWKVRTTKETEARTQRIERLKEDMEIRLSTEIRGLILFLFALISMGFSMVIPVVTRAMEQSKGLQGISNPPQGPFQIGMSVASFLFIAYGLACFSRGKQRLAEVVEARKQLRHSGKTKRKS
jgi:hypothetical protein